MPSLNILSKDRSGTPQKNLACATCQQRKVKCDREFPCSNCVNHHTTCVPVTQPRPRRRRLPERELLDRLRAYEDLLRRHKIDFEPLHGDDQTTRAPKEASSPSPRDPSGSEMNTKKHSPQSSLNCRLSDGDINDKDSTDLLDLFMRQRAVRQAWDGLFDNDNHLLFGMNPDMDAVTRSSLHPPLAHILRLWQVYLDNVNPLIKVTHTPSLQARVFEAAANLQNMDPHLEALLFGIYCMATSSLSEEDCLSILAMPKMDALTRYQRGCQQALLGCRFLQTMNRECLTAYLLYLFSMRPVTNPQSLYPMIGIAVRIAQRMGLHSESALAKCTVFEAEMRRRLWWALVGFDLRISHLSYAGGSVLDPTWNCKVPANLNDSDMRPDMETIPLQGKGTDAAFVVLRSELGDLIRNSSYYLEFANPAMKPLAKPHYDTQTLEDVAARLERDYIQYFDQGNPLHFMTTWSMRELVAKTRILQGVSTISGDRTAAERDAYMKVAFRVLECDTKLTSSPLTTGYQWYLQFHFPFPAYLSLVAELRQRPISELSQQAWDAMFNNFDARFGDLSLEKHPMMNMFSQVVSKAWEALQQAGAGAGIAVTKPQIIAALEQKVADRDESRKAAAANSNHQSASSMEYVDVLDGSLNAVVVPTVDPVELGGMGFGQGFNDLSWMGAPAHLLNDFMAPAFPNNIGGTYN